MIEVPDVRTELDYLPPQEFAAHQRMEYEGTNSNKRESLRPRLFSSNLEHVESVIDAPALIPPALFRHSGTSLHDHAVILIAWSKNSGVKIVVLLMKHTKSLDLVSKFVILSTIMVLRVLYNDVVWQP